MVVYNTELDVKDKSILKIVRESGKQGIRQAELAHRSGLTINCLRWRVRGLMATGLVKIVSIDNKVTIYPVEATV